MSSSFENFFNYENRNGQFYFREKLSWNREIAFCFSAIDKFGDRGSPLPLDIFN